MRNVPTAILILAVSAHSKRCCIGVVRTRGFQSRFLRPCCDQRMVSGDGRGSGCRRQQNQRRPCYSNSGWWRILGRGKRPWLRVAVAIRRQTGAGHFARGFLAMGSKVVIPQSHQQCSVWTLPRSVMAVSHGWELTVIELRSLRSQDPDDGEERASGAQNQPRVGMAEQEVLSAYGAKPL